MNPFLAQIIMFGGTFAPRGWAFCDGQLLPINANQALFSLLGCTYGGDCRTTFALPDFRGRAPVHSGNGSSGPGLTPRSLGAGGGTETNTLLTQNMPSHNHNPRLRAESAAGSTGNPTNNLLGVVITGGDIYAPPVPAAEVDMSADGIVSNNVGNSTAVNNMQPYRVINYIIALQGTFPSRS